MFCLNTLSQLHSITLYKTMVFTPIFFKILNGIAQGWLPCIVKARVLLIIDMKKSLPLSIIIYVLKYGSYIHL